MNLIKYMEKRPERPGEVWADLAKQVGTSKAYISQIAHGHRKPSPDMARQIQIATGNEVRREDLRPDIFSPVEERPAA